MKTEFLDLLLTRRSVRAYKPEQITPKELDTVLEAGTWAAGGSPRCSSPSRTRRRATRSPA